mgnify:CR=1 FL=1
MMMGQCVTVSADLPVVVMGGCSGMALSLRGYFCCASGFAPSPMQ